MRVTDIIKYSGNSINTRKGRTFLTTLGIVIGITAIVAIYSLSGGFSSTINSQFEKGFSTNALTVTVKSNFGSSTVIDFHLFLNDTEILDNITGVQAAVGTLTKAVNVTALNSTFSMVGVDFGNYSLAFPSSFTTVNGSGTIPNNTESAINPQFVIGHSVAYPYGNGTQVFQVGEVLNLSWAVQTGGIDSFTTFYYNTTIAGILPEIGGFSFGAGPSDNSIYLPADFMAANITGSTQVNSITVVCVSSDSTLLDNVSATIESLYGGLVTVTEPSSLLSSVDSILSTITVFIVAIASISLIVAGVGIMNIMIVSLLERTREIGILKAIGMKNKTVLGIFLSESLLIGLLGSFIGIALGWILAELFGLVIASLVSGGGSSAGIAGGFGGGRAAGAASAASSLTIAPVLTVPIVLLALLFGVGIAVLFGLYPAWRASRLNPVEALRYE